ncbi:MAG: sulfide/dihydroorotate dehydrogenase-like FAD/NAD-binding protein [Candidatus Omnitrophota bacterium]
MKIIHKEILTDTQGVKIIKFYIQSPFIAKKAQPGQFVVAMVQEDGERIPLTVVDTHGDEITLIMQEAGLSTKLMGKLNVGDSLYALVGPLGHATPIKNYGKVILVAGGVGIAEIYPVAKKLKETGNHVVVILGARTKDILFYENELRHIADELYVTTDDGSYGQKGFTTDVLKELLGKSKYDFVYAVGPLPMMEKVSLVSKGFGVKTAVSLNATMLDASGMCGGCRVTVDGKVKFACVDGPEFDGHLVDWDEMKKRSKMYLDQEKHSCHLHNGASQKSFRP